jgi:hypothetical protein
VLIFSAVVVAVFGLVACGGLAVLFLHYSAKQAGPPRLGPVAPAAVQASPPAAPADPAAPQAPPGTPDAPAPGAQASIAVNANDLWEDYRANEAKAELTYAGKRLEVTAFYHGWPDYNKPRKAEDGHWHMTFHHTGPLDRAPASGKHWWWDQQSSPVVVVVHFRDSEVAKLANLNLDPALVTRKIGGLVVRGTCLGLKGEKSRGRDGRVRMILNAGGSVAITDAVIVQELPWQAD